VSDVFTKAKRSQVMAAIRSRGNKATEIKLVSIMKDARITGWRRHPRLPGRPDFIFRRERLVLFVDGCFWHGCKTHCRMPRSRMEYWNPKIAANTARDKAVNKVFRSRGWRVVRIWEHSLKHPARVSVALNAALASCGRTG